jgi:thiamine-phosphate pyrophosphorylase
MPTLEAAARRLKRRRGRGPRAAMRPRGALPALWLVSDPRRLPDPRPIAARLPGGGVAGVLARGLAAPVLARLAALARARRLGLLVAGDGRVALRHRAGLHLPERRASAGLLAFLRARRGGAPWARLTLAAHGGAAGAARARRLGADLAFLSPAFATASHPGQRGLGPLRWAALARRLPCPAAALGGVGPRSVACLPQRLVAGFAAIEGLSTPCCDGATVSQGSRVGWPCPVARLCSADP